MLASMVRAAQPARHGTRPLAYRGHTSAGLRHGCRGKFVLDAVPVKFGECWLRGSHSALASSASGSSQVALYLRVLHASAWCLATCIGAPASVQHTACTHRTP